MIFHQKETEKIELVARPAGGSGCLTHLHPSMLSLLGSLKAHLRHLQVRRSHLKISLFYFQDEKSRNELVPVDFLLIIAPHKPAVLLFSLVEKRDFRIAPNPDFLEGGKASGLAATPELLP